MSTLHKTPNQPDDKFKGMVATRGTMTEATVHSTREKPMDGIEPNQQIIY